MGFGQKKKIRILRFGWVLVERLVRTAQAASQFAVIVLGKEEMEEKRDK